MNRQTATCGIFWRNYAVQLRVWCWKIIRGKGICHSDQEDPKIDAVCRWIDQCALPKQTNHKTRLGYRNGDDQNEAIQQIFSAKDRIFVSVISQNWTIRRYTAQPWSEVYNFQSSTHIRHWKKDVSHQNSKMKRNVWSPAASPILLCRHTSSMIPSLI